MGAASSTTSSEQSAQASLSQKFGGTCNLQCQNTESNVSVDIINSIIGGDVDLSQTCSTNGSCMIGSMMDATSDIYFKAANSSSAGNAVGLFPWMINYDSSSATSRQDISQSIQQSSSENCNIGSYNDYNDISILAENSTIGGNIEVSQQGSVQGQCQLTNSMSAAAYATGLADNTAQSGKDKKSSLGLSNAAMIVIGIILTIVLLIISFMIGREVVKHLNSK